MGAIVWGQKHWPVSGKSAWKTPLCVRTRVWWDQRSARLVTFTVLIYIASNFHPLRCILDGFFFFLQKRSIFFLDAENLKLQENFPSVVIAHVALCLCRPARVCLPTACLSSHQGGLCSHSYGPLKVQGCCAITKTALSITLTDRLKRGFNSYSSPWALHHRGRHPSTPLPVPLYRQLLSITRWLGKMASDAPEELLLCSLLSVGCGLERYRNRGKEPCLFWRVGLISIHTRAHGFIWRRPLAPPLCTTSWLCPSQANTPDCHSLTGGLVNPHYYLHLPNDRGPCPSTVPFQPQNSRARWGLRSPLSEFLPRLYLQPLKVHSLAWRHREKNQKTLKAGSDHRWNSTPGGGGEVKRRKNDVNSGDALPGDGAQSWKSLSMPGIVSELLWFTYLVFSFQSLLCYFSLA